jgi:hypothetical protein
LEAAACAAGDKTHADLAGEVGLTTGSLIRHLTTVPASGKLRLLDLPRLMRDDLGMRVIDLMTATLPSLDDRDLAMLREAAESAGCILTNLKMNQAGLDIASADPTLRRHSLEVYKNTMTAASSHLGVRWVRPLAGPRRPDFPLLLSAYRELIDHGRSLGLEVLIENYGWLKDDPEAMPSVIGALAPAVLRAQPDTGNWTDGARFAGLTKSFPYAVSCDFKFFALDAEGRHLAYDLRRCFDIAWQSGFRGPWCIEHAHDDLRVLLREIRAMAAQLRSWMRQ